MSKTRTETHTERFVNWWVVNPYIFFLLGLPVGIATYSTNKVYIVILMISFLVGTGFWVRDKWIFSSRLLIINRKYLGNSRTKVEISDEGEVQAATYIITKDENGKIGLEGPK